MGVDGKNQRNCNNQQGVIGGDWWAVVDWVVAITNLHGARSAADAYVASCQGDINRRVGRMKGGRKEILHTTINVRGRLVSYQHYPQCFFHGRYFVCQFLEKTATMIAQRQ